MSVSLTVFWSLYSPIISNRDWSVYFTSKLNMLIVSFFINLLSILSLIFLYLSLSLSIYLCYLVLFMLSISLSFLSLSSFLWRLITHPYVITVILFICTNFHRIFEKFLKVRDYCALGNIIVGFDFVNGLTLCTPWTNISYHCPS